MRLAYEAEESKVVIYIVQRITDDGAIRDMRTYTSAEVALTTCDRWNSDLSRDDDCRYRVIEQKVVRRIVSAVISAGGRRDKHKEQNNEADSII